MMGFSRFISLGFCIFLAVSVSGQSRTLHGKLTAFNTFPLKGVKVKAKKSGAITRTDSAGWFAIACRGRDIISIRAKGFNPVTRRVGKGNDTIRINLVFDDSRTNRQAATGYGYISEKDLTFATNHLDHRNNDFCNYYNIFELIEGRFPGVIVERQGFGGSIYIRGSRSMGGNAAALTVVDGVIVGGIGWIHPCDVKSIDIIKDGMTAMYGSEGANGVVIIETLDGPLE